QSRQGLNRRRGARKPQNRWGYYEEPYCASIHTDPQLRAQVRQRRRTERWQGRAWHRPNHSRPWHSSHARKCGARKPASRRPTVSGLACQARITMINEIDELRAQLASLKAEIDELKNPKPRSPAPSNFGRPYDAHIRFGLPPSAIDAMTSAVD